jgi:curved DNA-binding protein CbpA
MQLARALHPDKNSSQEAQTKLQAINEAWAVLKNKSTRTLYDRDGKEGLPDSIISTDDEDVMSIFLSIAGPIYGALFYRESTHPSTAHMPLSQRLIHTRVYGQMVAVLSTVAVMGFAKTMEGSGGIYRVEDAQLVRGEQLRNRRPFYELGIGSATPQEKEVRQLQEEQRIAAGYEQGRKDSFDLLVPLLYAPMLPLMRILGRGRVAPERLNMMMLGTIGLALSHAGYIMFSDSTVLVKKDD